MASLATRQGDSCYRTFQLEHLKIATLQGGNITGGFGNQLPFCFLSLSMEHGKQSGLSEGPLENLKYQEPQNCGLCCCHCLQHLGKGSRNRAPSFPPEGDYAAPDLAAGVSEHRELEGMGGSDAVLWGFGTMEALKLWGDWKLRQGIGSTQQELVNSSGTVGYRGLLCSGLKSAYNLCHSLSIPLCVFVESGRSRGKHCGMLEDPGVPYYAPYGVHMQEAKKVHQNCSHPYNYYFSMLHPLLSVSKGVDICTAHT